MRYALQRHPDSVTCAIEGVDVVVERSASGLLRFQYVVKGAIGEVAWPAPTAPGAADELWKHTCFEAFIKPTPGPGYFEFNFSPSSQWAAYAFASHRAEMTANPMTPRIEPAFSGRIFELRADVETGGAAGWPLRATWRLGMSAVIEEKNANRSYWALRHPLGAPDFHHAIGFAAQI